MGRNRACATGQRRDGQCGGSAVGVAHRQNGTGNGGFHNGHPHNLGSSCGASSHSIGQIRTIQGENQLAGLGYADLEQHLINPNFGQNEGISAGADDFCAAIRAILGEADIRSGGNGVLSYPAASGHKSPHNSAHRRQGRFPRWDLGGQQGQFHRQDLEGRQGRFPRQGLGGRQGRFPRWGLEGRQGQFHRWDLEGRQDRFPRWGLEGQ